MDNLAGYYFHQGTNYNAYKYLGCTSQVKNNEFLYTFRTWAPNADQVYLISDFTGWNNQVPFTKTTEKGIWELTYCSDHSLENMAYKYRIKNQNRFFDKGDPYAMYSRGSSDGASLVFTQSNHIWTDKNWIKYRNTTYSYKNENHLSIPINIYELHLGSFIKNSDNTYCNYREIADMLSVYLKVMGYTHVEIMPIHEYPYDGSWGYQACAFYAPTSRYGNPDDFRYFVNKMHNSGLGVLLDWVPAHFPKDAWGLYEYDGLPLYEYQGKDRIESRSWGTRFFDLGREEVQSFVISNALYFIREFHIDGLRVDAVASMLYLDYDKMPGEWIPNEYGTNINLEAVAFFQKLNTAIKSEYADILIIAEESGTFKGITSSVESGGLGFDLKWNMGFANDLYKYISTDPIYRKYKHKALNFPIMYAFNERYCLPISHDEVVHGKRSFIDKMFGDYADKFAQARATLMLIMTYPGKKLLFMGTEFAQFKEWDYNSGLEWFMLNYPTHSQFRDYVRALNNFYLSRPELWENDFTSAGFEWILPDENDKNIVAYRRISNNGDSIIAIISFSGSSQSVRLPVKKCKYIEVLFESLPISDNKNYDIYMDGTDFYINLDLQPYSGMILLEKSLFIKFENIGENYVL